MLYTKYLLCTALRLPLKSADVKMKRMLITAVFAAIALFAVVLASYWMMRYNAYRALVQAVEQSGGAVSVDFPPYVFLGVEGGKSSITSEQLESLIPILGKYGVHGVSFSGTAIPSADIDSFIVAYGSNLIDLDVSGSQVDTDCLSRISNHCENLEVLSVPANVIQGKGIFAIRKFRKLRELHVHGDKVDMDDLSRLEGELPGVAIEFHRNDVYAN